MKRARVGESSVLYVLWQYPVPSERFIVREIRGLAARGVRVAILVIGPRRRGDDEEAVAAREAWPVARLSRGAWGRALLGLLRHPLWTLRGARAAVALVRGGERGSWHRTGRMFVLLPAAFGAARRSGATVVHAHFATLPATFAMLLAAALRLPWGFSAHARDVYVGPSDLAPKVGAAAHVAVCSRAALADLAERVGDESKLHCIYHGLDPHEWAWVPRAPAGGSFRVLAVGRLHRKKGLEHLIRACAIARARGVSMRCEIVGDGPLGDELRRVAEEEGVADLVEWTPWLEPREVRARHASAAALAVPSVVAADGDRDNIPNALLEALATGLPVVASALPAIVEALDGGSAGLLVPPGDPVELADALVRLAERADLQRSLAENGRSRFEMTFSLAESAARMHSLLALSEEERR